MIKKKILVGISGGVDSSVAALLLKKAGFEVAGGYMKCWDYNAPECTGSQDERDARSAAAHMGIPFYVFDFRKEYKRKVFNYFLKEYLAGRTPNPDVMCNRDIKFGIFLQRALKMGFDCIATGHYARIANSQKPIANSKTLNPNGYTLLAARDKHKDQSYFLALVRPSVLDRVLFPLGDYKKNQVRKIAEKSKLPNASKPDSQGLCFVGEVKMEEFLRKYIKQKPGVIVDEQGKPTGRHQGVWFYTIGQRKGIELAGGPYYVLDKDLKKNILVVTKNEKSLLGKELTASNVNWLSGNFSKRKTRIKAMIRYRQQPVLATLFGAEQTKVVFDRPQRAITPGQAVVFYKKQELLGGGIIASHSKAYSV